VVIERLIFDDFYFVGYYVSNIITDRFSQKKKRVKQKKIVSIIPSIILSMSMTKHRKNNPLIIPSMIEFILPTKLSCR